MVLLHHSFISSRWRTRRPLSGSNPRLCPHRQVCCMLNHWIRKGWRRKQELNTKIIMSFRLILRLRSCTLTVLWSISKRCCIYVDGITHQRYFFTLSEFNLKWLHPHPTTPPSNYCDVKFDPPSPVSSRWSFNS